MPAPSKKTIYETLNATQIKNSQTLSLFPDTYPIDSTSEGWLYSDLHNLFDEILFPTQPSFSAHIWQNMVMPTLHNSRRSFSQLQPTNIDFYNNHVIQITHPYTLGTHHFKHAKDFKLSRYACWCMSRNNPNMIFTRTYFISPIINPKMSFNEMDTWCYQFARINLREQLAHHEKIMNAILYKHQCNFHNFKQITSIALYGDTPSVIRHKCGLSTTNNKPLSDYMGAATLFCRTRTLKRIIKQIPTTHNISTSEIYDIAYDEFSAERNHMIQNMHVNPSDDIFKTSIQQTQSKLKQTERDFILKYGFQKLR